MHRDSVFSKSLLIFLTAHFVFHIAATAPFFRLLPQTTKMVFKGLIINSKISKSIRESSNNQSRMLLNIFQSFSHYVKISHYFVISKNLDYFFFIFMVRAGDVNII